MKIDKTDGILEYMGIVFNKYAPFNTQYSLHCSGTVNTEVLREVVDYLQASHFYLNNYVMYKENTIHFEKLDKFEKIPIHKVVCETNEEWLEVANRELSKKFNINEKKALMRIALATYKDKSYIIVTMPHFISDGLSMNNVINELVKYYCTIIEGGRLPKVTEKECYRVDVNEINKRLDNDYSIFAFEKDKQPIISEQIPYAERKNGMIIFEIPIDLVNKMITKCKVHKCGVQGTLEVLASIAMARLINEYEEKREKIKIDILTAIDIRKQLNEAEYTHLGFGAMFVKSSQLMIKQENDSIQLAKKLKDDLNKFNEKNGCFKILNILRNRSDLSETEYMDSVQFREPYIFVSNLGKLEKKCKTESLKIEKMYGAAAVQNTQATKWGVFLVTATCEESMCCTVAYTEKYWNQEMAYEFKKLFFEAFMKFID